jgi:cytoplasmic tRNA 2-thiolation protein 2
LDTYINKRARAAIVGTDNIPRNSRVVVAFSGGLGSACLLRFLYDVLVERARGIAMDLHIVFIDDVSVLGSLSADQVKESVTSMTKYVEQSFPLHIVSIASLFASEAACTEFVHAATTISAREELLESLRWRALTQAVATIGAKYLLLGDCAKTVAVRTLVDVARGRGFALPSHVAKRDSRCLPGVTVFRPLREMEPTELTVFARVRNVSFERFPEPSTGLDPKCSLQRATDHFVSALQAEFPSTIHTVIRSVDRLVCPVPSSELSGKRCVLCGDDSDPCDEPSSLEAEFPADLCYACRRTYAEMTVPRTSTDAVRAYLSDCLLDDS